MNIDKDLTLPTEFTVAQLERLSELASVANSKAPNPRDHNLARKLAEYCSLATRMGAPRAEDQTDSAVSSQRPPLRSSWGF